MPEYDISRRRPPKPAINSRRVWRSSAREREAPSVAGTWAQVAAAHPELLVLAPCGFDRERALAEAALVQGQLEAVGADRVVVLDGSAYFNRPGPRLVDSLELLIANR